MELTFVNQYGDVASKRRRLAKACESCRSRKKRCVHSSPDKSLTTEDVSSPRDVRKFRRPAGDDSGAIEPVEAAAATAAPVTSPATSTGRRFVSDLNPEATFLEGPRVNNGWQPNGDIGVWVDRRERDELIRQKTRQTPTADSTASDNQRPHSAVLGPLIDVYFRKIHPILPLLDEENFRRDHAGGLVPEPLAHALCLVAAKDSEAGPYLRLNQSTAAIGPREFCSRLHALVMAALRVPCRFEKVTLIQILALASLHVEGQDGSEEATMCLTQAMHYTQTLGLHLGQQSSVASGADLTTKRLFWCLWSIDRVNSAIYGRPIMMSDIDIAIDSFQPGESGFPAFEVWLKICVMLNKVISFYRPGNPPTVTGWEENFPSFEEAVDQAHAWGMSQSLLATLHLFYLLVAVLSHRSRGVKYMPRASSSYVRQSHCSIELIRLMNSHLFSSLHPLPILPYAISLALSVSYQHLRQAQLQHQQEDARDDFRGCCQVLQKLRQTWGSADVIATIAKKVLVELDKATDLASFRVSRSAEGRNSPCTASLDKPHTFIDGHERDTLNGIAAVNGFTLDDAQQPEQFTMSDSLFEGMDDIFGTYLDPNYPLNLDDFPFVDHTATLDWNSLPT